MRLEFEKIGAVEMLCSSPWVWISWRNLVVTVHGEDLKVWKTAKVSDFILKLTHEETLTAIVRDSKIYEHRCWPLPN